MTPYIMMTPEETSRESVRAMEGNVIKFNLMESDEEKRPLQGASPGENRNNQVLKNPKTGK